MPKKAKKKVPVKKSTNKCIACSGSGVSSKGSRCYPCNGTGKKNVK